MKVIKRNGSIYDLDIDKIKTSILNSANDINALLTQADIKLITNRVLYILNSIHKNDKLRTTSSYEVRGVIYYVLINEGFKNIANAYMSTDFRKG